MLNDHSQVEIQSMLDDLLSEGMTPFALTNYGVQAEGHGEYLVSFHDSRIRSCRFSWKEGENFKEVFRAAIIDRVNRMSGPLRKEEAAI
jgi:hypothetical protein